MKPQYYKIKKFPNSVVELDTIISEYIKYSEGVSSIPIDKGYIRAKILSHVQSGKFSRFIYYKDEYIGGGICDVGEYVLFSKSKILTQLFYASTKSGILAVNSMKVFHEEMIKEARYKGVSYCMSSSMQPNACVFNRILEKEGWKTQGAGMIYQTFHSR